MDLARHRLLAAEVRQFIVQRPIARELCWLVLLAAAVQVLMPYRHDSPAHLLAGGAVLMGVVCAAMLFEPASAMPNSAELRDRAMAICALVTMTLAVGAEWLLSSNFDFTDLSFTIAGMALVSPGIGRNRDYGAVDRVDLSLCVGAAMLAIMYRYAMAAGPT